MRIHVCTRALAFCVAAACLLNPGTARAQDPPAEPQSDTPFTADAASMPIVDVRPSLGRPFADALADIRRLPSWRNAAWFTVGLGAAAATLPADDTVSREFARTRTDSFRPGQFIGSTPVQLSGAFLAYAIGRATDRPRVMRVGSDLIRAQVVAELMTLGVKQSVRRTRPDGGNFSFPSGHAAVSFASATVLHQHFGWKAGLPAYAAASYVAASRVQMERHFLSDVAFGATVGIVAGRTVTLAGGHRVTLAPTMTPAGSPGMAFVWLGRR